MHAKHKKKTYKSELTNVRGIGEKKATRLMLHFKTKEKLKSASVEELAKIAGVNMDISAELYKIIQDM